jgi:hypothetical protein
MPKIKNNHRMELHDAVCNLEFVPQIMSLLQSGVKANIELARAYLPLVGKELNGQKLTEFEFLYQIGWSSFLYFDFDQIPKEKCFDVLSSASEYKKSWGDTALEKTPEYMGKCMPIIFAMDYIKNSLHKKIYGKPLYLGWIADKFPNLGWFRIGNDDISGIDFSFLTKLKSLLHIGLDDCTGVDLDAFDKIISQSPQLLSFRWYGKDTHAYSTHSEKDAECKKYTDFITKHKNVYRDY